MFGSAYVVDIIADGEQVYDSGVFSSWDDAIETFHTRINELVAQGVHSGSEQTVRLIKNGEIRQEATIAFGTVLATL